MKVVIAMDSFKGSVESAVAGEAIRRGVEKICPHAETEVFSIADGGEGLLAALGDPAQNFRGLELSSAHAQDAVGLPMVARYLWDRERRTVFVESAEVLGKHRLIGNGDGGDGLVFRGSSFGLGVQVKTLLNSGAQDVEVGLGGTVTTDGGVGFLLALGARVWNEDGHQVIAPSGHNPLLDRPARIELAGKAEEFANPDSPLSIHGLVDVLNPLTGKKGAARLFAPQKGASAKQVKELESAMKVWGAALNDLVPGATKVPGSGAAGGLGAALVVLGAQLESGFEAVAKMVGLEDKFEGTDLVITGEGKLDNQTKLGKGPAALARLARELGAAKVVAFVGSAELDPDGDDVASLFDEVVTIHPEGRPLELAMNPETTERALEEAAASVAPTHCGQ